jgi:uncharacterized protein YcfL
MKNKILLSVCVATFLFAGCGASEKVEQLENTMKAVQNADEVANQVNTNNDLAQNELKNANNVVTHWQCPIKNYRNIYPQHLPDILPKLQPVKV